MKITYLKRGESSREKDENTCCFMYDANDGPLH